MPLVGLGSVTGLVEAYSKWEVFVAFHFLEALFVYQKFIFIHDLLHGMNILIYDTIDTLHATYLQLDHQKNTSKLSPRKGLFFKRRAFEFLDYDLSGL